MQTYPPSVGNNVKINPLGPAINSIAYTNGFLNLKGAEPSLGLPTGYTLTHPNSVYYFPVFGVANTYGDSRKFTGKDSLVFVNKNLGYNNINPTFNVDISGNFHALSAYIPNLSALYIVPVAGSNTIYFNASSVVFNSDLYANKNTFIKNLTANSIYTNSLTANNKIENNTIVNIYTLTGAYVNQDVVIAGNLTATNVTATSSIATSFLSASSAFFNTLTANYATINYTLSVGGDIYANNIHGQVDLDPFCQLYYKNNNQLSIGNTQTYVFAVRPSDYYSTDNISVPRTLTGDWENNYGTIDEDSNVLRPYFKNLQAVFDYVYYNNLKGQALYIWVDEDLIAGENKANYFTPDQSGQYSGCTITGNITAAYYSTEWLAINYPSLTSAGLQGGDFIWAADSTADINGTFSYLNLPTLDFTNIGIYGRYEIGTRINSNGHAFYSTWKPYTDNPRKITFRTNICANPSLTFGQFNDTTVAQLSTWNTVKTKSAVQGRQVAFSHKNNLNIYNINFEFNTNSIDSTGLVIYDGNVQLHNITISLLGTGIYTYGALIVDGPLTYVHAIGTNLADPIVFSVANWNQWNQNGYTFIDPNYFPGYGLAIVGNPTTISPTLVNFGPNTAYTGLINVTNGAILDRIDYGTSRTIGRGSALPSSLILDGNFSANALYQLGDRSLIQTQEYIFRTTNFSLSSKNFNANNQFINFQNPSYILKVYDDPITKINFKYINYNGSFSTLNVIYAGFTNWTFTLDENIYSNYINTYFNVFNGNVNDPNYVFYPNATIRYIDISGAVGSVGHFNYLTPSRYNTNTTMQYNTLTFMPYFNGGNAYRLTSPLSNLGINNSYDLNFYAPSTR
jgi:hypothetical protein